MRVLMASANYAPVMGGVETHMAQVAARLAAAGVDVEILTTDRTGMLPRREVVDGILVHRTHAYPRHRDYYVAPGILWYIRAGRFDLVHCQGYHTFVPPLAMAAAKVAGIPYVVTFHSGGHASRLRNSLRGVQLLALRPLLIGARRLIAVSEFEEALLRRTLRLSRDRFAIVANGADLPRIGSEGEARSDLPVRDPSLVLSIGRIERYKGHHRVIEALPGVLREVPDARLRIVGSGPYEASLQALAARLGVADRVRIASAGAGGPTAMAGVLHSAALVVQLSEYESNGLAAMEAAAAGRRVLVADTSGLAEIARRGWATPLPLDVSTSQLAAAIVRELKCPPVDPPAGLPNWDATAAALAEVYRVAIEASP